MFIPTDSSLAPSLVPVTDFTTTSGLNPIALASSIALLTARIQELTEHLRITKEERELRRLWRSQAPELWKERTDDLLRIRSTEHDWDGLGAEAPESALVDSAINLLQTLRRESDLPPPTRIVATPAGTVLFEWQYDGVYIEAEIVEPYRAEWMLERAGEQTAHWTMS